MLRPYSGEYLVSPIPLHAQLNICGYGCFYCFAKYPPRPNGSALSIMQAIEKSKTSKSNSLLNFLLRQNQPILISNTCDPFAPNNETIFLTLSEALQSQNKRIVVQTRGGSKFIEWASSYSPTTIYFSLTSDKDNILKSAEVNTPMHDQRLNMIKQAKLHGHHVIIGLNPYIPQWWADLPAMAHKLLDMGIKHIWLGEPHLSSIQKTMVPKAKLDQHPELTKIALTKQRGLTSQAEAIKTYLHNLGFNVFHGTISSKLNFWQAHFDLGFPFFPTLDAFITDIYENAPVAYTFDIFEQWTQEAWQGFEDSQIKQYLSSIGRSVRNAGYSDKASKPSEVLNILWDVLKFPSPFRADETFLIENDNKILVDENNRYILAYAQGKPATLTIQASEIGG